MSSWALGVRLSWLGSLGVDIGKSQLFLGTLGESGDVSMLPSKSVVCRFLLYADYLTHPPLKIWTFDHHRHPIPAFLWIYHSLPVLKDCLQADIMQLSLTNDNMQWRKAHVIYATAPPRRSRPQPDRNSTSCNPNLLHLTPSAAKERHHGCELFR
jgi:hypothetical protein